MTSQGPVELSRQGFPLVGLTDLGVVRHAGGLHQLRVTAIVYNVSIVTSSNCKLNEFIYSLHKEKQDLVRLL